MSESQEQLNQKKIDVFFDWGPYQNDEIRQKLNYLGIDYREPKVNRDLREKIEDYLNKKQELNPLQNLALSSCLKFLEMGMMLDDLGNNEEERHKVLLENKIRIGNEEMTVYNLSKQVNKLSGNKISQIIILSQLIDDETIIEQGLELKEKIEEIKNNKGFFTPEDLKDVYNLALMIINYILQT